MKIECKQLKDMESGLTLKVTQTAYAPSDTRAPLGVVTFTLETGEKLEFQLVKDGHSDMTQATPETIRFMEFEKVVHPRAKENQYFLVYWVFFGSGSEIPSICGARFNCFMRRLPAEGKTVLRKNLKERGKKIHPGEWAQAQGVSVISDDAQIEIGKKVFSISGPERWAMLNPMVQTSDPEGWTVLKPKAKTYFSGEEIYKHIECEGVKKSPRYRITARAVKPSKREKKPEKKLSPEQIIANQKKALGIRG
ncbi:MAG: hypothetical protein WCP12_09560 [bacterium]